MAGTISFSKTTEGWVSSDISVDGKFNVHLEAASNGRADLYFKTAGTKYTTDRSAGLIFTRDPFSGGYCAEAEVVYGEATMKIISNVEPTNIVITTRE